MAIIGMPVIKEGRMTAGRRPAVNTLLIITTIGYEQPIPIYTIIMILMPADM